MADAYKTNQPLPGVDCKVTECKFNCDGQKCSASGICVKPISDDRHETDCSTFTKRGSVE